MPQELTEKTSLHEMRLLDCALTSDEFIVRATDLASHERRIEEAEEKKKNLQKRAAEAIGGLLTARRKLAKAVATRSEKRDVQCTWHKDWASKSMLLRRDDTGEVVTARTMTPQEVQQSFDYTDEEHQLGSKSHDDESQDEHNEDLDG